MQRKASAEWKGGLKDGKGTVSSASGILSNTPYSFTTRFENAPGTNPEELIAAAHAACFSMALSAQLGEAKLKPESIATTATLTMEKLDTAAYDAARIMGRKSSDIESILGFRGRDEIIHRDDLVIMGHEKLEPVQVSQ